MSSECCPRDLSSTSCLFGSFFSLNEGSTIRPSFVLVDGAYVFICELNRANVPFIRVWSYDSWVKFCKSHHKPHALQIFGRSFFLVQWTIWAISVIVVKMRWDVSALLERCIPGLLEIIRWHITCRTCKRFLWRNWSALEIFETTVLFKQSRSKDYSNLMRAVWIWCRQSLN